VQQTYPLIVTTFNRSKNKIIFKYKINSNKLNRVYVTAEDLGINFDYGFSI